MILKALGVQPFDVATLRQLAISRGGLLDNSLRQKAWPSLLDIDVTEIPAKPGFKFLYTNGLIHVSSIIISVSYILSIAILNDTDGLTRLSWSFLHCPDHYLTAYNSIVL